MKSKETSVLFTGHRIIAAADKNELMASLYSAVLDAYMRGYTDFYCGGAMGFDLMAGECVLSMRDRFPSIVLHLMLPSKDQTRSWPESEIGRYNALLESADDVEYIAEEHFKGCEIVRNKKMVDLSSLCIAYLKSTASGTGSTVKYAEKCGLRVINLCKNTDQLSFETED